MYGLIYKITNKITNEKYIGQTTDTLESRWYNHCSRFSACKRLYNAIKKYGKENFEISIIVYANNKEELDSREKLCIKLYNTLSPNGYNLLDGGSNGRHSESSKHKMSKMRIGIKNGMYGKTHTHEAKKKISLTNKKRKLTLEQKNKQFKNTPRGINHPLYGKARTEKVKAKLSLAHTGKTISEETRKKISMANKGKIVSEETKNKISKAQSGELNHMFGKKGILSPLFGIKKSEKTKKKISDAKNGKKHKPHSEDTKRKMSQSCTKKVKIICVETNTIYNSIKECAQELNLLQSKISLVISGKRLKTGGFTFRKI